MPRKKKVVPSTDPVTPVVPPFQFVTETYSDPTWNLKHYESSDPNVFNGKVAIRRYRVTVELVEEPLEVLQARLKDLWEHCTNCHHRDPLRAEARKLGIKLGV